MKDRFILIPKFNVTQYYSFKVFNSAIIFIRHSLCSSMLLVSVTLNLKMNLLHRYWAGNFMKYFEMFDGELAHGVCTSAAEGSMLV